MQEHNLIFPSHHSDEQSTREMEYETPIHKDYNVASCRKLSYKLFFFRSLLLGTLSLIIGVSVILHTSFYFWIFDTGNNSQMLSMIAILSSFFALCHLALLEVFSFLRTKLAWHYYLVGRFPPWSRRLLYIFLYGMMSYLWISLWMCTYLVANGNFFFGSITFVAPLFALLRSLGRLVMWICIGRGTNDNFQLLYKAISSSDDFYGPSDVSRCFEAGTFSADARSVNIQQLSENSAKGAIDGMQKTDSNNNYNEGEPHNDQNDIKNKNDIKFKVGDNFYSSIRKIGNERRNNCVSMMIHMVEKYLFPVIVDFLDGFVCFSVIGLLAVINGNTVSGRFLINHSAIFSTVTGSSTWICSLLMRIVFPFNNHIEQFELQQHNSECMLRNKNQVVNNISILDVEIPSKEGFLDVHKCFHDKFLENEDLSYLTVSCEYCANYQGDV